MLAAPRDYAAFSRGHSSVMPMIRAMATETVVDPAMANWRSPIWPTKHTPNNPARDRTDRTGNHKARTRSSSGTDHVGTCGSRDRCDCHDDRDCEHKVAHLISPPEEILLRQLNAQNMTPGASGKRPGGRGHHEEPPTHCSRRGSARDCRHAGSHEQRLQEQPTSVVRSDVQLTAPPHKNWLGSGNLPGAAC